MELVSAKCTSCGGEIQLNKEREEGFCLHCGSKIIVKEAIQNFRIDNTHLIKNYYSLLNTALDGNNYADVEKYSTQILEVDSTDAHVWYLRGKAIGWQSTTQNNRIPEAISCWINAIKCCENSEKFEKTEYLANSTAEIIPLFTSMVHLLMNRFRSSPDMDVSQLIIRNFREFESSISSFNNAANMQVIDLKMVFSLNLNSINKLFIEIYRNVIKKEYDGTDNKPDDYDFSKYIERISASTYLLDQLLYFVKKDDPIRENYYINLIKLHRYAINALSWKYSYSSGGGYYAGSKSLTKNAIDFREGLIENYELELNKLRENIKLKDEQSRKEKQQKYWDDHPEEYNTYCIFNERMIELQNKRQELSFFQLKEKSTIDEELQKLEEQILELKSK